MTKEKMKPISELLGGKNTSLKEKSFQMALNYWEIIAKQDGITPTVNQFIETAERFEKYVKNI